ncbi:hemolysin [Candidatus Omnitrophus magneticus]|uniref:Hemolysin n=1 Tax=Candidatus Omnitrophus magneticus TaxID=1609969 RepID=A0A0F0CR02_9BACT|nr:hemolysin [Candidatus Omnitrophus magneticus]
MLSIYTFIVIVSFIAIAFFSGIETAFTAIDKLRLKMLVNEKNSRAIKLNNFLKKEEIFLGTTLVGTNLATIIAATMVTRLLAEYLPEAILPLVSTIIVVPVTLVFCEIIPKIIARQFPTTIALYTFIPLSNFSKIFHPIIVAVNAIARIILFPFMHKNSSWEEILTKSDIKALLYYGRETGEVEQSEVDLIYKVLDFEVRLVKDRMVPLYRVSSVFENDTIENLKSLVFLSGFSRFPVYKDSKVDIQGVINIYDVLFDKEENIEKYQVKDFVRSAVYVDIEDRLDIALARLRHHKQPMGVVLGQNKKAVGIITIEDIMEDLVGNIEDKG